ncbi:MAG: hypothetical protein HUU15_16180 [Candidatus Brocadiae bacterium]|nr:hypothetical protein [Candidatus Brocadiia bacterium]
MRPASIPILALATSALLLASRLLPAQDAGAWTSTRTAWAREHLKLADEQLAAGNLGFADTQAGIAEQLVGAENAGVKAWKVKRLKAKLPEKGWVEGDWKAYGENRGVLHRKEAAQAAGLAVKAKAPLAAEIEGWALRLDPDQAEVRKRRGEERVPGLGWLPADTAGQLRAGKVKCAGVWEAPEPEKYASWDTSYAIPSEHFLFRSTLPRERLIAVIASLEALYRIWEEAFEGIAPLWGRKELPEVWVLRTLDDYQACVTAQEPGILERAMTRGIMGVAVTSKAFFREEAIRDKFIPVPFLTAVASHECSHLIHRGVFMSDGGDPAQKGTLWNTEGIAMLMEAMGMAASPDWNGVGLAGAGRGLDRGMAFLDRLPDLFGMDANTFNADAATHYEASYILAHFLMYGQGGAHRRDLLKAQLAIQKGESGVYDLHFHQLPVKDLCALARAHASKIPK